MKKNEFVAKLDNEIIPALRERILHAYDEGYTEGHRDCTLRGYLESHQLKKSDHLVDLGLPSGTMWINPKLHITFTRAKELGLKFPSKEQINELVRCKLINHNGRLYIKGLNGNEILLSWKDHNFALWTDESIINENFFVNGTILYNEDFYNMSVYAGDLFRTLFVLPDYVM